MSSESISATTTINGPAEAVFAVLADPTKHPAIDGGGKRPAYGAGWVLDALDAEPLTGSGQIFRMGMRHPGHPNPEGRYRIANAVRAFDPPRAISWEPGEELDDGTMRFGGWLWRYDLVPLRPSATKVTLTYDWSGVSEEIRGHLSFPPFPDTHLEDSLALLAGLVTG